MRLSLALRMTAYVVKVMSLVAERQSVSFGQQGRRISVAVQKQQISKPVEFLLSSQTSAGIFRDPNPVYHRGMVVISLFFFLTVCLEQLETYLTSQ